MVDRKTLLQNLPPFEDSSVLIVDQQDTEDIMNEISDCHSLYAGDYDRIYKFFDTGNIVTDIRTLFDFCKKYIPYNVEQEEDQTSRSPAAILTLGNGDCKHYAQFIGGIVSAIKRNTNAKYTWCYRYGNYDIFNDVPGHVFIVVKSSGNEYWIDPVLSRFNQRDPDPIFYIDEKIPEQMLRRVAGIADTESDTMQSLLNNSETRIALRDVNTSPVNVQYQLAGAINVLMNAGVMDAMGNVDPELMEQRLRANDPDIVEAFHTVQAYITQNAIGNFFDDAFKAVQHVAAGMGMQIPRAAFLGLVRLNAFHYADKLWIAEQYTDSREKLEDLWWRVGGDEKALRAAVDHGKGTKPVISGVGIGCNGCTGGCIGCVETVSGAACLIASAAIIVSAIIPIITKLIAGRSGSTATNSAAIDPNTGLPYGVQPTMLQKVQAWLSQNPIPTIGGVVLIAYLLTDKQKKRA